MGVYCQVSFPLPLIQTFLYRLPDNLASRVREGSRVIAPLGKRQLTGYVLEILRLIEEPDFEVKEISCLLDERPKFSDSFLEFIKELASRSFTSAGVFLEMAQPPGTGEKSQVKVILTEKGKVELEKGGIRGRKKEILKTLSEGAFSPLYLRRKLKIKEINSLLSTMKKAGLVEVKERILRKEARTLISNTLPRQLNFPVESEGLSEEGTLLVEALNKKEQAEFLLKGPFERRLEFILQIIRRCQNEPGCILILVPEIHQIKKWQPLIDEFRKEAVILHSQLPEKTRAERWKMVESGRARIILGTRTVLFLPVSPVILIVVDEEQDDVYYQTEGPAFDIREAAEIRADAEKGIVVLTSSCPDISRYFRHKEKGTLIDLGEDEIRYSSLFYKKDMDSLLRGELKTEIETHLERGGRVFFFLKRKGYAGFLYCPDCGFVPKCPDCHIALILRKKENDLYCRYCGRSQLLQDKCSVCGQKLRPGRTRGTQYLQEQLANVLPAMPVAVLEERLPEAREERLLKKIEAEKIRVVIGTEYAIHRLWSSVFSLVVLINPEVNLNLPDFRASQTSFITIYKVMELLRNEKDSRAVVVTSLPDHQAISAAVRKNYQSFFDREIGHRQLLNYPPFCFLVDITLSVGSVRATGKVSRELVGKLNQKFPQFELVGPKITRQVWKKQHKEIKLYLKLGRSDQLQRLKCFLKEFRIKNPALRLSVKIWQ
jgi:primosomal protein N' (replication factor Y)